MPSKPKPESPVLNTPGRTATPGVGLEVDLKELWIYLERAKVEDVRPKTLDGNINLTTDGVHTVKITLDDYDRKILRGQNIIRHKSQIHLEDRWWTLVQATKQGDRLDLTFEDAHVANMRTYAKYIHTPKSWGSRCQFAWRLILEAQATDESLRFLGPCSQDKIPPKIVDTVLGLVEPTSPFIRDPYVSKKPAGKVRITVDTHPPTREQIDNINIIMGVCARLKVRRKVAVAVIMIGIHESSLRNLSFGQSPTSVDISGTVPGFPPGLIPHRGIWQQDPRYYPASGSVEIDAAGGAGYMGVHKGAVQLGKEADQQYPNLSLNDLADRIQNESAFNFYGSGGLFRLEAERIVTAWGWSGGDISTQIGEPPSPWWKNAFDPSTTIDSRTDPSTIIIPPGFNPQTAGGGVGTEWHRGAPLASKKGKKRWQKENTWDCLGRMASEVNWYRFMYWDDLIFMPGKQLFEAPPYLMPTYTFREFDNGVDFIDGDFDINKLSGSVTINTRIDEWPVDPGNVITLEDMGVWDGKWIVTQYSRSIFSHAVTVVAKKPMPTLPEPTTKSNVFKPTAPGASGGELPGGKKSKDKKKNIRDKITAWAISGTGGPPPRYGGYGGGYKGQPGNWPSVMDCSDFVAQCYAWGSGLDEQYDPNANGWSDGSTATLNQHGTQIIASEAQHADLVLWIHPGGAVGGNDEHVAILVEDYHGPDTKIVHHGGGTPGPSYSTVGAENNSRPSNNIMVFHNYID